MPDERSRLSARLLFLAAPALAASVLVLALARVPAVVWAQQLSAVTIAAALAMALGRRPASHAASRTARVIVIVSAVGLAVPLLWAGSEPRRWVSLGPVRLYVAPLLLPAFLQAWALLARGDDRSSRLASVAAVIASLVIAAQPDASQGLALLAGLLVAAPRARRRTASAIATWTLVAGIAAWTVTRPDPLQPVPHVEGVVALAFAHAWVAGVGVVASAMVLIAGLWLGGLAAAAAYFATLFLCALAGLTPAPLVGYGAAPWIGYGLMAGLAPRLRSWAPERPDGATTSGLGTQGG